MGLFIGAAGVSIFVGADVSRYMIAMQKMGTVTRGTVGIIGKKFQFLTRGIGAVSIAMAALGIVSAKVGATFEKSIVTAGVKANATQKQLQNLSTEARRIGKTTAFTAQQAADAMGVFSQRGFKYAETMQITSQALLLAGATSSDMTQSANLLGSVMKQLSLDMSEAGHVTDVLTFATLRSALDMGKLTQAMKMGGAMSNAYKFSLEETVAVLMALSQNNLSGQRTAKQLEQAMKQLGAVEIKRGSAMDILNEFGIAFSDVDPSSNNLLDIMDRLSSATSKISGDYISMAKLIKIVGSRAAIIMGSLFIDMREGNTNLRETAEEMVNLVDFAKSIYQKVMATVWGDFKLVVSAATETLLTFFDTYKDELKATLRNLKGKFDDLSGWIVDHSKAIKGMFNNASFYLNNFSDIFEAYKTYFNDAMKEMFSDDEKMTGMSDAFQSVFDSIGDLFVDMLERMMNAVYKFVPIMALSFEIMFVKSFATVVKKFADIWHKFNTPIQYAKMQKAREVAREDVTGFYGKTKGMSMAQSHYKAVDIKSLLKDEKKVVEGWLAKRNKKYLDLNSQEKNISKKWVGIYEGKMREKEHLAGQMNKLSEFISASKDFATGRSSTPDYEGKRMVERGARWLEGMMAPLVGVAKTDLGIISNKNMLTDFWQSITNALTNAIGTPSGAKKKLQETLNNLGFGIHPELLPGNMMPVIAGDGKKKGTGGDKFADDHARAKAIQERADKFTAALTTQMEDMKRAIGTGLRSAVESFGNSIGAVIMQTKTLADAWKQVGQDIIGVITEAITKWAILKALMGVTGKAGVHEPGSLMGLIYQGIMGTTSGTASPGGSEVKMHRSNGANYTSASDPTMSKSASYNNQPQMQAVSQDGGGGGGNSVSIYAMDASSFQQFAAQNRSTFDNIFGQNYRSNDQSRRASRRGR